MGAHHKIHVVLLKKVGNDVRTEDERDAAIIFFPTRNVLVWVSPKQVTDETSVRNVGRAHKPTYLIHVGNFWGETTMHADDFFIDETTDGHTVEHVTELLPQLDVVAPLTFVVEAINPGDGSAFVIATKLEEVLWVLYLVSKHQGDGLQALLPAINIIAEEDIVAFWREPATRTLR